MAIAVNIVWGLLILGSFSYYISKQEKIASWKVVGEHVFIALILIIITNYVGQWIAVTFV